MLRSVAYPIPPRGLATNFNESEMTPDYGFKFRNRVINAVGGAEKRQGLVAKGTSLSPATISAFHELIQADGTAILFASTDHVVFRYSDSAGTWSSVYTTPGFATMQSVQMGDRLIFCNGVDPNFYTTDGTNFYELKAVLERGATGTGADKTTVQDADITSFITDTQVAVNDLFKNVTLSAFAIITAVNTASATHTEISSSSASVIGRGTRDQGVADRYEIVDLVELNVVPTDDPEGPDNTATLNSDSSANGLFISAVSNWLTTEIRVGDWVRNTTVNAVAQVTALSTTQVMHTGIVGQTAGDSVVLMKPAMPITTRLHVHFGRLYMIDERDQRLIRISGANNPEDMTTDAGTLDSSTFQFGNLQPKGDTALAMASFQRFFCVAGKNTTYLFQGTTPIGYPLFSTASADSSDFELIGLFPKGVVDAEGLISIGNDLVMLTVDGVESISMVNDASTLGRANLSEALRNTLRDLLASNVRKQLFHYPKRSWLCLKIGQEVYVFNYTPYFGRDQLTMPTKGNPASNAGSWSVFDGLFGQCRTFFVRADGSLVAGRGEGRAYDFDQDTYDDDGTTYKTEVQTAWLTMDEPRKQPTIKAGKYIRPYFNTGTAIVYTIRAEGGYNGESAETITVSTSGGNMAIGNAVIGQAVIGGSSVIDNKLPLRWRGKEARFTFTTEDQSGPDVLSRLDVYFTRHGKR